jgi:hypothetical protein
MNVRTTVAVAVLGAVLMVVAGCSGDGGSEDVTPPSPSVTVPVSANVTLPPGPAALTAPGSSLQWSETAFLPADAFRPGQQMAGFTVTGIEPGVDGDLPESFTHGGTPFYVRLTITQIVDRQRNAMSTAGFAGSVDGTRPALTLTPPDNFAKCQAAERPQTLAKGQSYATCLVALADPGTQLSRVIYWADTGEASFDFKSAPVVWSDGTPLDASGSAVPTS